MNSTVPPERNPAPVEELRRQLSALKAEVTSQQWLLDALESQSAQYRALFELMPGSVVLLDSKGFIREANPHFCRMMGYAREELVGQHVTQIIREKPEIIERNILRMISGETLQHEVTYLRRGGALHFSEWRAAAVTLPDGSMNILAVSNDIIDRRRAELDVSKFVRGLSDLLQISISRSVRLDMILACDLPRIQADAAHVQQVLMNLVANASEAIGSRFGVITVATRLRECDVAYLAGTRTGNKPQPGRYVVLEVSDTGSGTGELTRGESRMSGGDLGMETVLAIAQGHYGAMMVSSERGQRFISVLFPAAPAVARVASEAEEHPLASMPTPDALSSAVLSADNKTKRLR